MSVVKTSDRFGVIEPETKEAAFERIARIEGELLDRLRGEELGLLNDLIEAWTVYCDFWKA